MNQTSPEHQDTVRLSVNEADDLGRNVLIRLGYTPDEAGIITDHLVNNAISGYAFAGLPRILAIADSPELLEQILHQIQQHGANRAEIRGRDVRRNRKSDSGERWQSQGNGRGHQTGYAAAIQRQRWRGMGGNPLRAARRRTSCSQARQSPIRPAGHGGGADELAGPGKHAVSHAKDR